MKFKNISYERSRENLSITKTRWEKVMNEPIATSPEQTQTNYLQPDPAWDYYEVWNCLLSTKRLIEKAFALMKTQEHANPYCDHEIRNYLLHMERTLGNIDLDIDFDA